MKNGSDDTHDDNQGETMQAIPILFTCKGPKTFLSIMLRARSSLRAIVPFMSTPGTLTVSGSRSDAEKTNVRLVVAPPLISFSPISVPTAAESSHDMTCVVSNRIDQYAVASTPFERGFF